MLSPDVLTHAKPVYLAVKQEEAIQGTGDKGS